MLHSRGHTCHEISWAEFKCMVQTPPLPTPTHLPNMPQVDQADILHLFSCCTTGICFMRTWFYSIGTCRNFLTVALILYIDCKQFFGFCKYFHIARGVMKCRPPNLILIFVCNQLNRPIGLSTTALRPISMI